MREVRTIAIGIGSSGYEAVVGSRLLPTIGERVASVLSGARCAVIADTNTAALFGEVVVGSLAAAGFHPIMITVPVGENAKSLTQAGAVCDEMAAAGFDRTSFVVALGGGVVGDLGGFAAAIYHRGIPFVQVPTTLLAQVDSSIGGKTAVNTAAGKNLLGAVHQPALVLADVDTLLTLPPRELHQGFAEIVKHAIIADASLFDVISNFDRSDFAGLVATNIEIKAAIAARDEHDTTRARAILNFGHTVGHAIERAAGYGTLLHGEAVSLGIVAACAISISRAGLSEAEREKVITTLRSFNLPTQLPSEFPRELIMPALLADKKFERGQVRFVVTPMLGSARLTNDVSLEDIRAAVDSL